MQHAECLGYLVSMNKQEERGCVELCELGSPYWNHMAVLLKAEPNFPLVMENQTQCPTVYAVLSKCQCVHLRPKINIEKDGCVARRISSSEIRRVNPDTANPS
jgi:hypothetical protein